jgi:peptide deformylase
MERHYSEEAIELRVPPDSEVLNLVATEIPLDEITSPQNQALIDTMFRVAHGRQGDAKHPTLVGLSAPQIGVLKRVAIIGLHDVGGGEQPELKEFINPEIVAISEETAEGREGCFSTGRVCGIVERAFRVTVVAYDRNGERFEHTFEGFPARVAQHEIDHLNGIRFPDRITNDDHLHWVEEADYGSYRQNWRTWPVQCLRETWEAIKSGSTTTANDYGDA